MQIAGASTPMPTATEPVPLAWLFWEERGPMTAHGGRWEHTTLELWDNRTGAAVLTDGRMTYPHDPGTVEFAYESVPWMVRDGVDADAATEQARAAAELLLETMGRARVDLEQFRVAKGARPERNPEQFDVWLRDWAGESVRYLVPAELAPASLLDARRAAQAFATFMRATYERQDPGPQHGR